MAECYFCMKSEAVSEIDKIRVSGSDRYEFQWKCARCGPVRLYAETLENYLPSLNLSKKKKGILSICLRNDSERRDRKRSYGGVLNAVDLKRFIDTYSEKDAIEKMENALLMFEKRTNHIGESFKVDYLNDYPLYHCFEPGELVRIIEFLYDSNLIKAEGVKFNVNGGMLISANGYERLREIKKVGSDPRQCFVAMWLDPDMDDVFNKGIKPAIEFIEEGATEPRLKALRIDNKEHTNDINDEIIFEIRRSRFMVCDLTGYRGGVYWEAGFAYGLGLEVIYTCRKDWVKPTNRIVKDANGKEFEVPSEGIHFDLEHRNRIEWEKNNLPDFKERLTKRIKAVIV